MYTVGKATGGQEIGICVNSFGELNPSHYWTSSGLFGAEEINPCARQDMSREYPAQKESVWAHPCEFTIPINA
jgi:hypothetical protein